MLFSALVRSAPPAPVGIWNFDDPKQLTGATAGEALNLRGNHLAVVGPRPGDGAVRIGPGSYYECLHQIAPNGGGRFVNIYSMVFDVRIPRIGPWYCFFQTDPSNKSDGDCFIRANDGAVGVGQTGYSTTAITPNAWQRLIVAVDNSRGVYRLYLDGDLLLRGGPQSVDGRFALAPMLLLFADEDGEDAQLDAARIAFYDQCLTAADAAELGTVPTWAGTNHAPAILAGSTGPTDAVTGEMVEFRVGAQDADADAVRIRLDWGDGGDLSPWSALADSGQQQVFTHAYTQPGSYTIRALAQDQQGLGSAWEQVRNITVTGTGVVRWLTAPYLQNVTTNAITIMWETDVMGDGYVDYGVTTNFGAAEQGRRTPSGSGTEIYRSRLTGLTAGTDYFYRVSMAGQTSPVGKFTTAPLDRAKFAFAVWSDSQGHNHGSYASDPFEPTKSMFRHMATNGIAFAVTSGDLAEDGNSYTDTRRYYLDRAAALLQIPWFVAWGNHDAGASSVIRKFADMPSKSRPGYDEGYGSFSFDYAGCHFICIDYASSSSDIQNWLEQDLQASAGRSPRFTFLFIHVPPFCELWIDGSSSLRASLVPLLETYGVNVCFSGHTHEYSRGQLNGVHYCITGGGSWLDMPEVLVKDWPHMTVGGFHEIAGVIKPGPERGGGLINEYVKVEVDGDTFTASMLGFAPDGSPKGVLDQFTQTKPALSIWITAIRWQAEGILVEWAGPAGSYHVEHRQRLGDQEWEDLDLGLPSGQKYVLLPHSAASGFFRVRLER